VFALCHFWIQTEPNAGPFTVGDLAGKVRSLTGQNEEQFTVRQAAYDLRKLRAEQVVGKPGRTAERQDPRSLLLRHRKWRTERAVVTSW